MTSTNAPVKSKKATPRRGRTPKYDWEAARALYVDGKRNGDGLTLLTLQEVGEELGIPPVRVREKSAREHWPKQREQRQIEVAAKRSRERTKELAKSSVEFDSNAFRTAQLGLTMVQARIVEISQEFKSRSERKKDVLARIERGEEIDDLDVEYRSLDARELETLGRAAETWQRVGKNALGEPVGTIRAEHTGADGGPIQHAVDVTAELSRDDPKRLRDFYDVMRRAGLEDILDVEDEEESPDDEDIEDAVLVDEEPEVPAIEQ